MRDYGFVGPAPSALSSDLCVLSADLIVAGVGGYIEYLRAYKGPSALLNYEVAVMCMGIVYVRVYGHDVWLCACACVYALCMCMVMCMCTCM